MSAETVQENVYFILVRPEYLGNIGGTARVMKNFRFRKLRFVSAPRNYKDAEARKMAVAAFDILKSAELFDSVGDALRDISLAIGTTSAQQRDLLPAEFDAVGRRACEAAQAGNKVAIVFGDERNGLSRDELERCHYVATIPTDPSFAALNLVQAVGIAAYELSRHINSASTLASAGHLSSGQDDDEIFAQLEELLETSEFTRTFNRKKVIAEFRAFYQRAIPTAREASLLKGALIRLNTKLKQHPD